MFIGSYILNGARYTGLFYANKHDFENWHKRTFSPSCKNIQVLDFKISGEDYLERKYNLVELAKNWQHNFADLPWSYSELAEIENWFYKNAKRYGLLEEFKINGIC